MRQVLSRHSPSLLLFSGHSFVGAAFRGLWGMPCGSSTHWPGNFRVGTLALELPSGRVQLPPSKLLIEELSPERASRLSAVVLNGCETVSLGFEIVRALPHLSVICWVRSPPHPRDRTYTHNPPLPSPLPSAMLQATITEDSAARAFSQGFYDAVGTSLLSREKERHTAASLRPCPPDTLQAARGRASWQHTQTQPPSTPCTLPSARQAPT